jgi:hypothetical protein
MGGFISANARFYVSHPPKRHGHDSPADLTNRS